jgi:hypothetical protein
MKRSAVLTIVLLAAFLPVSEARRSRAHGGGGRERVEWSATDPPINLTHIFEGLINKGGKPVGFHARPGGQDPPNARVVRILDGPNRAGVYTADVEIRDVRDVRDGGRWLGKTSTLYPNAMSRQEVIGAILNAFRSRSNGGSEKFRGPSGRGFTIEGYFQNGRINTAYPVFQR